MIAIPCSLVRQLRSVFRRVLSVTSRNVGPSVRFLTDSSTLTVSARSRQTAVLFRVEGTFEVSDFAVPFEFLLETVGGKKDQVTLERRDDQVVASWSDKGIPKQVCYDVCQGDDVPSMPRDMTATTPEIVTALRDAMDTTDREAARYAINCIQLRGQRGDIVATDGRQLLLQNGFEFPWASDLLVQRNKVFSCRELQVDQPVDIGRCEDHLVLRVGPWTLYLPITKRGRFPKVDDLIPQVSSARSTLHLESSDARFLVNSLKRLPGSRDITHPITLDLNGHVAVLAKGDERSETTMVHLANSERNGDDIRVNTDRNYLARAAKLGFESIRFYGPNMPAHASDGRRD